MIENLPDELYQLESEYEKSAKLRGNIILKLQDEKRSETYSNVLKIKQYSELYTDDNKKYFNNPNDVVKSGKNFYEKLNTKRQPPEL